MRAGKEHGVFRKKYAAWKSGAGALLQRGRELGTRAIEIRANTGDATPESVNSVVTNLSKSFLTVYNNPRILLPTSTVERASGSEVKFKQELITLSLKGSIPKNTFNYFEPECEAAITVTLPVSSLTTLGQIIGKDAVQDEQKIDRIASKVVRFDILIAGVNETGSNRKVYVDDTLERTVDDHWIYLTNSWGRKIIGTHPDDPSLQKPALQYFAEKAEKVLSGFITI